LATSVVIISAAFMVIVGEVKLCLCYFKVYPCQKSKNPIWQDF
jgi:hypothetical protein